MQIIHPHLLPWVDAPVARGPSRRVPLRRQGNAYVGPGVRITNGPSTSGFDMPTAREQFGYSVPEGGSMVGGESHADAPFTRVPGRRYFTFAPEAAHAARRGQQLRFTRGLGYWLGPAVQAGPMIPPSVRQQAVQGPLPQGAYDMPGPDPYAPNDRPIGGSAGPYRPRPITPDMLNLLRQAILQHGVQY